MISYDYKVDIPMCTYNHEKYVGQAIEGVINQLTNFEYRLIIGDDFSTDGTRHIISEYTAKFPSKIKAIFHERNIGAHENSKILFAECKAKYIALLDGDDYWTNPLKLQKQVDFLDANPQIAGCFHDVVQVDENSHIIKENHHESIQRVYSQLDSLTQGGSYATSSLVFRSLVLKDLPRWFLKQTSDYSIDLLITEFGDIAHINENMGAYRIHSGGMWQGGNFGPNHEFLVKRFKACLLNPKFRKNYGGFFNRKVSDLALILSQHYQKEGQHSKRIKHAWNYIYYTHPKDLQFYKILFGTVLFPSLYKRFKNLQSTRETA